MKMGPKRPPYPHIPNLNPKPQIMMMKLCTTPPLSRLLCLTSLLFRISFEWMRHCFASI